VTVHAANASQTDLRVQQFTVKLSATGKTAAQLDALGLVLTGTGVSMDAGHAGEYTIDQTDVTVGHGSTDTVVGSFQLSINSDSANSQDALKGLQINLALASS
jgi:CO/xanthine dehydrogenase Mo-binding subunit